MLVAEHLDLDVPRILDELLDELLDGFLNGLLERK